MPRRQPVRFRRHLRTRPLVGLAVVASLALLGAAPGVAASSSSPASGHSRGGTVQVVSGQMPIQGLAVSLGARRPTGAVAAHASAITPAGKAVNTWTKQ